MVAQHMITHTLVYVVVTNGYLLVMMVAVSPRVWGHHDYPEVVRSKVPAQTKAEKLTAVAIGLPWMIFVLGFPAFSTLELRSLLGGVIPFGLAFLHPLIVLETTCAVEVILLDWLIISKLTPTFVIIPGTTKDDYRDMSYHFRGHLRAAVAFVPLSLIIGAAVSLT
jgi:hypothetical protein